MPAVGPAQDFLQVIEIIVSEDAQLGPRKPRGIDDAGVDQLIDRDDIIAVEERADDAGGGGITGGKGQRGLGAFEGGQSFLQDMMRSQRTAQQAGRPGARAELADRCRCRLL